jgi:hypothetical protein
MRFNEILGMCPGFGFQFLGRGARLRYAAITHISLPIISEVSVVNRLSTPLTIRNNWRSALLVFYREALLVYFQCLGEHDLGWIV